LARLGGTSPSINNVPHNSEKNQTNHQTQELNTSDSINSSDIPSKNDTKQEQVSEPVDCSDRNGEKTGVNDCTNDESDKSKWPADQIEDIETKAELLPQNTLSNYDSRLSSVSQIEHDLISMEVECDANPADKTDIDSGIENMEVDEVERRESLKRQRESSSSSDGTVLTSNPIVMVTPAIEDSLFQIISRIFCVEWRNNEMNSQAFRLEFDESFDQTSYHNLIQMILMDTISQIINSCDYENALKIYNHLKPIKKSSENSIPITSTANNEISFPKPIFQNKEKSVLALCYILECYVRVSTEEKTSPARSSEAPIKELFADIRCQCIEFAILVLTNSLSTDVHNTNSTSILAQFLYHQCLPCGFISGLVSSSYQTSLDSDTNNTFRAIFGPLMQTLWLDMQSNSSLTHESSYKLPLQALNELCHITIGKVNKPICQLVCFN